MNDFGRVCLIDSNLNRFEGAVFHKTHLEVEIKVRCDNCFLGYFVNNPDGSNEIIHFPKILKASCGDIVVIRFSLPDKVNWKKEGF